jgi:hypothetical protein
MTDSLSQIFALTMSQFGAAAVSCCRWVNRCLKNGALTAHVSCCGLTILTPWRGSDELVILRVSPTSFRSVSGVTDAASLEKASRSNLNAEAAESAASWSAKVSRTIGSSAVAGIILATIVMVALLGVACVRNRTSQRHRRPWNSGTDDGGGVGGIGDGTGIGALSGAFGVGTLTKKKRKKGKKKKKNQGFDEDEGFVPFQMEMAVLRQNPAM